MMKIYIDLVILINFIFDLHVKFLSLKVYMYWLDDCGNLSAADDLYYK